MMNRKAISETIISFEAFAASANNEKVGDFVEVPMNAWGSVVARYKVTSASVYGAKVTYSAELVH